jgi:hypothetical protein
MSKLQTPVIPSPDQTPTEPQENESASNAQPRPHRKTLLVILAVLIFFAAAILLNSYFGETIQNAIGIGQSPSSTSTNSPSSTTTTTTTIIITNPIINPKSNASLACNNTCLELGDIAGVCRISDMGNFSCFNPSYQNQTGKELTAPFYENLCSLYNPDPSTGKVGKCCCYT